VFFFKFPEVCFCQELAESDKSDNNSTKIFLLFFKIFFLFEKGGFFETVYTPQCELLWTQLAQVSP